MIIVTGADNVGKSTLIKLIKKELNFYTFHSIHLSAVHSNYDKSRIYSLKMFNEIILIQDVLNKSSFCSDIILDRSYHDEYVYSTARGYNGEYVFDEIEPLFLKYIPNIILVMLIDYPENLVKRDDGNSIFKTLDEKEKEITLFEEAFKISKIPNKFMFNVSDKSLKDISKNLKEIYIKTLNEVK